MTSIRRTIYTAHLTGSRMGS